jgi:hypothetical protein
MQLAFVIGPAAAAFGGSVQEDGPTDEQILSHWRDEWGRQTFERTGTGRWQQHKVWHRLANANFPPGTNEFTSQPVIPDPAGLITAQIEVWNRTVGNRTEHQVTERITPDVGPQFVNYFPTFSGNAGEFTFFNAAGSAPGEFRYTCRVRSYQGRQFLLVRATSPDNGTGRSVLYSSWGLTADTAPPPASWLISQFRELWGVADFQASGATPWQVIAKWKRTGIIIFDPEDTEFTARPPRTVPERQKFLYMFSRTVNGRAEYQVTEWNTEPDDSISLNYFPVFEGTPDRFTFYNAGARFVPVPGEYQESNRTLTVAGQTVLTARTIAPDGRIIYQLLEPTTEAPPI